ncbi:MAG: MBL fold metallo-hydrolase [Lachnospiraceae bacterium]|nr:MBL fold metallo-hydrolase [Lachnospiraceae bacterium]
MKITMLGTGNAAVTECYNTCFVLSEKDQHFLVDGGGGNGLLSQLKKAGLRWQDMREMLLTHKHIDHLLGMVWMVRMICQNMSRGTYRGEAVIYGHEEVIDLLGSMAGQLFAAKEMAFLVRHQGTNHGAVTGQGAGKDGCALHLVPVEDGETRTILGRSVTFFDIRSAKAKQFGFSMELEDGGKLTCCGDEPYNEYEKPYAQNSRWLLHEAFCLHSQADIFKPYQKHHSTVKDACELAQQLGVENLLLYHTEDKNIRERKELYLAEGKSFFNGNLYVPDDLETLEV